jgi:hypothetical protein
MKYSQKQTNKYPKVNSNHFSTNMLLRCCNSIRKINHIIIIIIIIFDLADLVGTRKWILPGADIDGSPCIIKTRLKILPVLTREHYTSLLHWV